MREPVAAVTPEWSVPELYKVGQHVVWRGIKLVCTRGHFAGEDAVHPWDPGAGWPREKAAMLWAPNGPFETAKLDNLTLEQ